MNAPLDSTLPDLDPSARRMQNLLFGLLPVAGFLAMFLPVYLDDMVHVFWISDDNAHGPLVIAACLWVAWERRKDLLASAVQPRPGLGIALFVIGLLLYAFSVSQDITFLKLCAQWPIIVGCLLCLRGLPALRVLWFPLVFLLFVLPMPALLVDTVTQPLKQWVSAAADQILYAAGYPVAREGVVLAIGQYQLLVADACSGLRSLIALAALGVMFLYIVRRPSLLHNAVMLAAILPMALLGNLIRVIILVLVTYYLGDEAGQGFLHGAAGMVVFMADLLGLMALDALLARVLKPRATAA